MPSLSSNFPQKYARVEAPAIPRWKRTLDLCFCIAVLPFFAVATLIVAVVMSITSPGPIFFRQERVGYMGRKFKLYKFRTMHVGADVGVHRAHFTQLIQSNAPMQKMDAKRDSRLVPGGWLLRASGFDELPQILNVLRGEMSVVGPRPCIVYEYDQFTVHQRTRCRTAPGLTGLWQVSGKNRTTFERMIELDIQYAREKTLWMDVSIIARTIPALCIQIYDTRVARSTSGPKTTTDLSKALPAELSRAGDASPRHVG